MPNTEITITYTNWRGETGERRVVPERIYFGATVYHPTPQWLMSALDVEKNAQRDFACADIAKWNLPNG